MHGPPYSWTVNKESREVVLVYPDGDLLRPVPPYSVWLLATTLVKSGYDPKIIDERLCNGREGFMRMISEAASRHPLFIGFSCTMSPQLSLAESLRPFINSHGYSGPWVVGGAYVSLLPSEIIRNRLLSKSSFQILSHGHAFETVVDLCQALGGKRDISSVRGVSYLAANGKVVRTEDRGFPTYLPVPNYDLIEVEKYIHEEDIYTGSLAKTFSLYTSSGCLYGCKFCLNAALRKWVGQSSEEILSQIMYLHSRFDVEYIRLIDDNPLQKPERILKLCRALDRERLDIKLYMDLPIQIVLSDCFEEISRRLVKVYVGVESGSDKLLRLIAKPQNVSQIKKAVKILDEKGISARYSIIRNLPKEDEDDIRATESLIEWIKANHSNCAFHISQYWTPIYGTPLYTEFQNDLDENERRLLESGQIAQSELWASEKYREVK